MPEINPCEFCLAPVVFRLRISHYALPQRRQHVGRPPKNLLHINCQVDAHPLLLQIPYSIGIGLGMIIFFNRVFKKKFNEEPSPLKVEMFNYQQELDHYTVMHEQDEDEKRK